MRRSSVFTYCFKLSHNMSILELTILMGGLTYLLQQHFSSFTKLKDPKRLLQYGQCNFPLVQNSLKK